MRLSIRWRSHAEPLALGLLFCAVDHQANEGTLREMQHGSAWSARGSNLCLTLSPFPVLGLLLRSESASAAAR
jgi:hypothetical protein